MSKVALGIAGIGGVTGIGTVVAYKTGLFSPRETKKPITVKDSLIKDGYELANTDEQFRTFFKEFKSDGEFMKEINKYKQNGENLEGDSNGDLGKIALKALCSSYFESENNSENAIKWCVLRIQDKPLTSGSWITDDGGSEHSDWKNAFDKSKSEMVKQNVDGVTAEMQSDQGYEKLKQWCLENKKLSINTKNKPTQSNVITWCSK